MRLIRTHSCLSLILHVDCVCLCVHVNNLMYESRCRVVALAHFSIAGCQSDWSATTFLCQQFDLHSQLVCVCVYTRVSALTYCCKCCSIVSDILKFHASWTASIVCASMQIEGLGSGEFCQSLVV